jgi:hypothetical protein
LYAILSFWTLFPVIGAVGKFITVTAVISPLIGMILGPSLGALAVTLGGIVGASIAQTGPFGPFSFVPGAASAFCSGLLYDHRWRRSALLYAALLLVFAFYPGIGPAWLHPSFIWFQLAGLVLLISPLQSKAVEFTRNQSNLLELSFGIGVLTFIATLFGHVVGSMMFELIYWHPELDSWRLSWQLLTPVYPIERVIITMTAVIMGVPLFRTLKAYGFEMGGGTHAAFRDTDQAD